MSVFFYIFIAYIIIINLITFAVFGLDKHYARQHMWRISEATLIMLCVVGGSVGGILGMKFFRHKTRHLKFVLGVPFILIIQLAIAITFVYAQYGIHH